MPKLANRRTTLLSSALFAGALWAAIAHYHDSKAMPEAPPPAPEVDVATVAPQSITEWQNYSGRLEAVDKVDIRPLVSGTITAVHYKDGGQVEKGDMLFVIDRRPYEAELARAKADLAAAEAQAAYADAESKRAQMLAAADAIARRDYDARMNAGREADARVKAAEAALATAEVNLSYTTITAPVAGRVARAELTEGNIVAAGASAPLLTTVVSTTPIYASFNVDEQTYLRYLSHSAKGRVPVALGLADENGYSHEGEIVSVDNHLDTGSGAIRVRARFDNADGALIPGLYARLKVGGGLPQSAILVEDAAIGTDQAKKYVFVVDAAGTAHYREVTLGNAHEGLRIVTSGLDAGERVVVNGMQRIRAEETVNAHDVTAPAPAAAPAAATAADASTLRQAQSE